MKKGRGREKQNGERGRHRGEEEEEGGRGARLYKEHPDYLDSSLAPFSRESQDCLQKTSEMQLPALWKHRNIHITYSTVAGPFHEDVRRLTVGHSCLEWL